MLEVPDSQPSFDAMIDLIDSLNSIFLLSGFLVAIVMIVLGLRRPARRKFIWIGLGVAIIVYLLYAFFEYIFLTPYNYVGGPR